MVAEARYLSLSKSGSDIQASVFAASGRHAVIAGASGSGKTAAAKVILDHDLAAGRHVVIADPDDVYGDYGRLVTTTKALLRYLAAAPGNKGIRLAGDKPADLAGMLETIFEWAGREAKQGHLPQVTVVVDELTAYLGGYSKDAQDAGRLEGAIGAITNRGRGRGIWGLWVTQRISQLPDPILHTTRLALIGQHKDVRDWKIAARLFTGLGDASRMANLRPAEFAVWWPGEADIFTLRPPCQGGYRPIVNPSHVNELEAGDGETDVYALLADTSDEVYARLARCPQAFDLLAELTGIDDDTRDQCWQFIEGEHGRRMIPVPRK